MKRPSYLFSYININSSCIFIYLEQECRNPSFTFTLHYPAGTGQIGQVPENCGNFLWAYRNLPGAGGRKGRWGRGFFGCRRRAQGIPGGRQEGTTGLGSIQPPIAFLRAAGADSGLSGGVVDRTRIARSSIPSLSQKPITADHLSGHSTPARRQRISFAPARFLYSTSDPRIAQGGQDDGQDHSKRQRQRARETLSGVAVKAAIYARVSTSNGSQTCENQLLELRRYCDARGWIVHAEYTDEMSGAKDRRPGLDRLLLDARRARIQRRCLLGPGSNWPGSETPSGGARGFPVAEHSVCVVEGGPGPRLRQRTTPSRNPRSVEPVRTRAVEREDRCGPRARSGGGEASGASIGAGASWETRIRAGHLSARRRQTPRCRQINAPAVAITGPTKPLRSKPDLSPQKSRQTTAISNESGGPIIRSFSSQHSSERNTGEPKHHQEAIESGQGKAA